MSVLLRINRFFKQGFTVYIKVVYAKDPKGGYYQNEGNFFSKKEAISAWRAFTNVDIIKEFKETK